MRIRRVIALSIVAVWAATAAWHTLKPLPPGTHVATPWQAIDPADVRFIADVTTADAFGRPVVSHAIFDEVLATIRTARDFIVLDFFLFNGHRGAQTSPAYTPPRRLSDEITNAILERKREQPSLQVLLITDPINEVYGARPEPHLERLRAAGVDVVVTDLGRLRDSNPGWSSFWRLALGWWLDAVHAEWLPHPFEPAGEAVPAAAWATLANFKANHRKVVLADDGRGGLTGIVSSGNPHDASGAHSNVAVKLSGAVLEPLFASELAIADFSGWTGAIRRGGAAASPLLRTSAHAATLSSPTSLPDIADGRIVAARVLTEAAIREALIERLAAAVRGDAVDIAMFYLAERDIVDALLAASDRGVGVRLILDPNKDAFGRTKSGIPNRQVAGELVARSDGTIKVRWYRTHGEQFHTKLVVIRGTDRLWLTAGSANLTRRNVRDYNLEANVALEAGLDTALGAQVTEYFETLWSNRAPLGIEYTADFEAYADPSQLRYWQYRVMEATGLSSF